MGESDAALRAVLEPLSDGPVHTVRIGPLGPESSARHQFVPVLLARLTLEPGLLLFLFGATRPTPPEVLRELLPRAVGTVFVGPAPRDDESHRVAQLGLPDVPWVVSPVPVGDQARALGRTVGLSNTTVPHRIPGLGGRHRAKQPIAAVLQKAVADRRGLSPRSHIR
ncbi:MAG: hypothetical protein WCA46_20345, partial [Actinocatenispora sp.]